MERNYATSITNNLSSFRCIKTKWNLSKLLRSLDFSFILCISFSGSPAEKADLEVADEILEINGQSLENSSHTDIIAHIHNVSLLSIKYNKCICVIMFNLLRKFTTYTVNIYIY